MSIKSDIAELEQGMKDLQELVERKNLAESLSTNRAFKKLILEEYFVQEAARLVQMSGDIRLSELDRSHALAMAQATGHLKRYLSAIVQMGTSAENSLVEANETLDELRAADQDD
ncbi:hypothetical protein [Brucella anthropi]|uniref:Uncharacterized protein n=1 Tax=Brucella anthropi TaxID=529 RepID=A0A8I0N8R9_BRUAN|nr:hypothetical protein [Brucella anthropi]KAB2751792.1 hypothetical protein F9L05_01260 [Brucella anthropi]MBE0563657.1 hypothetical protein [Brucella anthropi]